MGADSSAENAPYLSAQFVCPSPKVLDFQKKDLSGCPWFRSNIELAFGLTLVSKCDDLIKVVMSRSSDVSHFTVEINGQFPVMVARAGLL